ncbi:MAG: hypothetical protein WAN10_13605 [Candidatus Acidiferrales bacterium]
MPDHSERTLKALAETLGQHQWLIQMLVKMLEEKGALSKDEFRALFVNRRVERESFGLDYAQTLFDSEGRPRTTWD